MLEIANGQPNIIFSNLSPDYYYKNNGIDVRKFGISPMPNCHEERYSFASAMFHYICQTYAIVVLHFITSGLVKVVNDEDLFNITAGIFTTVHRKQDWMQLRMRNGKV